MLRRKLVTHFVPSCGLFTIIQINFHEDYFKIFPIMLALYSVLSETYYTETYAGIICLGLHIDQWLQN